MKTEQRAGTEIRDKVPCPHSLFGNRSSSGWPECGTQGRGVGHKDGGEAGLDESPGEAWRRQSLPSLFGVVLQASCEEWPGELCHGEQEVKAVGKCCGQERRGGDD